MKSKKNIVLIGMMGSGKSSIGKILSKKLNVSFVDIDRKIEEVESLSISDIFKKNGEKYFRKIEEEISLKFLKLNNKVIALGGGGYVNPNIRKYTLKSCISIWLEWKSETLLKRIKNSKKRPIAISATDAELIDLIKKRSNIYSKALFHIML